MPSTVSPRAVRVRVPAKLNLHLSVGPARPDGFHDIVTVFHAVDLADEVLATPAPTLTIAVRGDAAAAVPVDAGNLAWQAAAALADAAGIEANVHLELLKAIPVAGGMAGGSADAAGALLACARLWDLDATATELAALASRLGSDVAFPLLGHTALGTGRGEILDPVPARGPLHWVFALAGFGISAGDAYRELDRLRAAGHAPPPAGPPDRLVAALANGDLAGVAATLVNDLQPAAVSLVPALAETLAAGTRHGALAALVSGSGPTCAFLCQDAAGARQLALALDETGVCDGTRVACGPVAGAAVISGG